MIPLKAAAGNVATPTFTVSDFARLCIIADALFQNKEQVNLSLCFFGASRQQILGLGDSSAS